MPETIQGILEAHGYRRIRGPPIEAWARDPPAAPCTLALPGDAPASIIAWSRGGRLTLWEPLGPLPPGEYTVWSPEWRPRGKARVEGPGEARLLEGEAGRWDLVGPHPWWPPTLRALEEALATARPHRVILAPYYLSPTPTLWPGRYPLLLPVPRPGWRPPWKPQGDLLVVEVVAGGPPRVPGLCRVPGG